jgi:DamX protein
MSEVSSTAAEPSYVSRLALRAAPFNEAVDTEIFYKGPQFEQTLNLTLHLLSSSNRIASIQAAIGLGKTCLLTQLSTLSPDNLRFTLVQGSYQPDPQSLLFQCLRGFGVDEAEIRTATDAESLLKTRLVQLRELDLKPAILIDDADLLTEEVIAALTRWLSIKQDDECLLQAVICSKTNIAIPEDVVASRVQKVDLQALQSTDVGPYLLKRLNCVGFAGELPFSDKDIKQFYKQSKGSPAVLNKLAHQRLLGVSPSAAVTSQTKLNLPLLLRGIGASILVVCVVTLLWFQDSINSLFETDESIDEKTVIELSEETETLTTVVVDEQPITSNEQAERNELAELVTELEQNVDVVPFNTEEQITEELVVETKQEVLVVPSLPAKEKQVPQQVINVATAEVTTSGVHQQDWILQQRTTDYTYQLMGSWDHEELAEFIDKYALTGDVAEFESIRNGRTWYVLIYGVYPNKKSALDASKNWPAPMNTLPSWLRRFDSVQKQINDKP